MSQHNLIIITFMIQLDFSGSNHQLKEEKEPLFIEDRTNSFKLSYAIRYKVNKLLLVTCLMFIVDKGY